MNWCSKDYHPRPMWCGRRQYMSKLEYAKTMTIKQIDRGNAECAKERKAKQKVSSDFRIALAALTTPEDFALLEAQFFSGKDGEEERDVDHNNYYSPRFFLTPYHFFKNVVNIVCMTCLTLLSVTAFTITNIHGCDLSNASVEARAFRSTATTTIKTTKHRMIMAPSFWRA